MFRKCEDILEVVHNAGFCHGDFRENNILVSQNGTVNVIDFDWAGKSTSTFYPCFMNHATLKWHESAQENMPLDPQHDLYWLKLMKEAAKTLK